MKGIIGRKLGMSQRFKEDKLIPVTIVEAGPCLITDIKNDEKDGYRALQLGFDDAKEDKLTKPQTGHFNKNKIKPKKVLIEFRVDNSEGYEIGKEILVDVFSVGEKADIVGVSKGKGFAGPMKRWNFKGQGASHGAHRVHRAPGSIGSSATPSRVFPGKRMAGQMGNKRITVKDIEIVEIDAEKNLLVLKGAIPGPTGGIVILKAVS